MRSDILIHYGVVGMKWGVRRTPEQLGHRKTSTSDSKVKSIVRTWNKQDREMMALYDKAEYETSKDLVYRNIQYLKNIPVAFIDIESNDNTYNVSVGTRSGDKYRGQGFATQCVQSGMNWWEENKNKLDDKPLSWWAKSANVGSQKLAEKFGFKLDDIQTIDGEEWKHYLKK